MTIKQSEKISKAYELLKEVYMDFDFDDYNNFDISVDFITKLEEVKTGLGILRATMEYLERNHAE